MMAVQTCQRDKRIQLFREILISILQKKKKKSVFKCSDAFKHFLHKCTFSRLYGPLTVEYNERKIRISSTYSTACGFKTEGGGIKTPGSYIYL